MWTGVDRKVGTLGTEKRYLVLSRWKGGEGRRRRVKTDTTTQTLTKGRKNPWEGKASLGALTTCMGFFFCWKKLHKD